ncbi:hypothetical protein STRCI_005119 [Streptomyces cinnabarinus]|uniref:Lipoprotein n=1 Tax=Streptomyces cinnabarinus TaxID=67287 RepID=A0ABY7KHF6_9ACTN|nr:hypothetical protein [Streptomyces cinnabarinus]WAZ23754.1 hypothetical protein STRCI_005119 [Streptomyces cinnabarinus]
MKRSSGARIGATVAMSAVTLALITGCSSDESKDSSDNGKEASASPTQAAKALSAAELEKLLLTKSDIKGYKVDSGDDTLPKSKSEVKPDKAECAPLAWSTAGLAPGDTEASASNTVAEDKASTATAAPDDFEDAFDLNMTFVGLSSYDGDGAEKTMKALSDGVAACSDGYGLAADGENSKVTKVASAKASGQGDESVAFSQGVDMDGEGTAEFTTEVVRKGNTIATFYTVNLASLGTGKVAEIPAEVVTAQVGKLK